MDCEGSATIESSLVFPLVIFFTVMIISISIFVFENVSSHLKFNNELEQKAEETLEVEDELILENKMLFKNTWDALYEKGTELTESIKKKIKRMSIINTINDTDYGLEIADKIFKGDATWMKTDQLHHI